MFRFRDPIRYLLLLVFANAVAHADAIAQILETAPPGPAVLGKMEWLNIRVSYSSDQEVMFSPDAYFQGKRVFDQNHFQVSGFRPAGAGEAAVALAFVDSRKVDTVKIYAWGKTTGRVIGEASLPVDVTWTGNPKAAAAATPDWARDLDPKEQSDRAKTIAAQQQPWTGEDALAALAACVMFSGVPAYLMLQLIALCRLRGGIRKAATLPLIPMALVFLYTLDAYNKESNLWPLVMILTSPLAAAYLLAIIGSEWLKRKSMRGVAPLS